jgi:hypothetical protein
MVEHLGEDLQRLGRRARRPLFLAVITMLAGVVVLALATPPQAMIRGICTSGDVDDPGLVFLESEAFLPTSLPPLPRTDVATRFAGDRPSAWAARPPATVRDRGPPVGSVIQVRLDFLAAFGPRRLDVHPPRAPLDLVVGSLRRARAPFQGLGDGSRRGRKSLALGNRGRNWLHGAGGRSPPCRPAHGDDGARRSGSVLTGHSRRGGDERGKTA